MVSKDLINIIFIIPSNYLHILTPYINSIKVFDKEVFRITVFSKYLPNNQNRISDTFFHNINYFVLSNIRYVRSKKLLLRHVGIIINFFIALIERNILLRFIKKRITNETKNIIIAIDPISLFIAAKLSKNTPFVYFPQELLHSDDVSGFEQKSLKKIERKYNKNAIISVSFDKQRALLLKEDNRLRNNSSIIIPNSIPGSAKKRRSTYLRDKFNIHSSKKIVLYTGGLANYNLTLETIQSTVTWPENAILVMHYFGSEESLLIIKDEILKTGREIYISNEMLPFQDIKIIYQSADIGLALYGNMTVNHKFAGLSSGKMFNFLYNAVPVITNATDILLKNIKENKCGECINNISEIGNAINKIILEENKYIVGCINSYSAFEFAFHHKKLEKIISSYFKKYMKN